MKTIIEMAREAGFVSAQFWPDDFKGLQASVERFAALVEAEHTERLLDGVEMPEPFGLFCGVRHDPPKTKEFWGLLNQNIDPQLKCNLYTADQLRETVAAAVLREREECAKVCEDRLGGAVQSNEWWGGFKSAMKQCASAIRNRSKT